jgi:hypothetical protein
MSPAAVVLSYTSCLYARVVVRGSCHERFLCEVSGIVKGEFAHMV